MNHTKIEWVKNPDLTQGFTANPIRGKCLHNCHYCYAWSIYKRYGGRENMTWHPKVLEKIEQYKKPSTIFMGSMYDLFGDWVLKEYLLDIYKMVQKCQQHTFLFLTKNPTRYYLLSENNSFPTNCWFGITTDTANMAGTFTDNLCFMAGTYKYVSAEPLLEDISPYMDFDYIDWLIIGSLNKNGRAIPPKKGGTHKEWVLSLIEQADKYKIPIFIKDELLLLYPDLPKRKEIPYLKRK